MYQAMAGTDDDRPGTGSEPLTTGTAPTRGYARGVYVSVTGTIVGRLQDDSADSTWANVPVGVFGLAFKMVNTSGTTATVTQWIY